nr:hypothetical protein [Tanacetum cinerariifolium]
MLTVLVCRVTRPLNHIPLRAILGVLQIGIRAKAIENHVKNVLLDYNHFKNIALVQKGLHETFMHMLVAALVDTIMLDSEDSTVTYTTVSSPYEGRSRDVSPGVDGPLVMPEDPYAYVVAVFQALPPPDYVPGPEELEQAPPSPVYIPYVSKPVYPEYIPPEDDDPEDDDDEDPEEDPADYPADHDDDDEEEEHPASADSIPPPHALRIPSPPLPASPPIFPIPLPAASPPLQLLSSDRRADRPEVTLPPQKRLSIVRCPGYEAGESS